MEKVFNVQASLLRGAEFKDHNMNKCLLKNTPTTFELLMNHDSELIDVENNLYSVNVSLTIKSFEVIDNDGKKDKGEPIYTATVKQSCLFIIQGFSIEELELILNVNCPSITFPYARSEINRMLSETQMSKPSLQPVMFESVYKKKKADEAKAQAQAKKESEGVNVTKH